MDADNRVELYVDGQLIVAVKGVEGTLELHAPPGTPADNWSVSGKYSTNGVAINGYGVTFGSRHDLFEFRSAPPSVVLESGESAAIDTELE